MGIIQVTDLELYTPKLSNKFKYYAGVDNGFSGATAIVRQYYNLWEVVDVYPYNREAPQSLLDFYGKYKQYLECVVLEKPFISLSRSSVTKTNYEIFGRYLQTLDILEIKHIEVMPKQWQKILQISNNAESSTKEQSIDFVKKNTITSSLPIRMPAYSNRKFALSKWADLVKFNDNWADAICMAITAKEFIE